MIGTINTAVNKMKAGAKNNMILLFFLKSLSIIPPYQICQHPQKRVLTRDKLLITLVNPISKRLTRSTPGWA